jgi:hypothetical protein
MLAAAAWLYSGGEFCAERAAASGDVELFKAAASLSATARTHDMGAWELATREAEARRRAPSANTAEAFRARILNRKKEGK